VTGHSEAWQAQHEGAVAPSLCKVACSMGLSLN